MRLPPPSRAAASGWLPAGVAIAVPLLAASGCDAIRDSAGAGAIGTSSDTVTAVVAATIGSTGIEGTDEYIFADVRSVAADEAGLIYVADRIPPSLRVYGPEGEFIAWVGREGEGPGEFTAWPSDILADDGRLYVRGERVTVFGASAASEYPDSVLTTWRIPPYSNLDSRRARFDAGIYYYPQYTFRQDEPGQYYYMKFGAEGFLGDTVHVPAFENVTGGRAAFYMVGGSSGRKVPGLNIAPFAPRAAWDMTGRGTIITGDGATSQLQEFGQDGQVIRTIDGPALNRRAVPEAERSDSMAALELRIDSLPVPLDEVENVAPEILSGEIPDSLPHFLSIHVGASDRIWIQRWSPEGMGSSRYYDVVQYDGSYAGTVVVPAPLLADPPPFFGDSVIAGIVMDPATDVHSVVVVRFTLPSRDNP